MKIAIAGYGVEGESNYRYWSNKYRDSEITIVDQKQPDRTIPDNVSTIIGDDAFGKLQDFDLVIRTAGLAPNKIKTNGKIWSATNEIFAECPAMIIGVTGTKGKSTTSSLIASMLNHTVKKVWLIGNIGNPGLDIIDQIKPDDIVVYELSSFQLWDLEKSPHIAIVLAIELEHQDVHSSLNEYVGAKANITKYQDESDILIYNLSNDFAKNIAETSKAKLVGYLDKSTAHIENDYFYYGEQKICSANTLKIMGYHNQQNACVAIDAVWSITQDIDVIQKGLEDFKGLPHRLNFVREVENVRYYDDSISTTPGSAIAALKSFNTSKVAIIGGSYKGADFYDLANEFKKHDVKVLLIGAEAQRIANACNEAGFNNFDIIKNKNMVEIVKIAQHYSKPGGVVLLSPACASFGMFKNYADRGDQFVAAVEKL